MSSIYDIERQHESLIATSPKTYSKAIKMTGVVLGAIGVVGLAAVGYMSTGSNTVTGVETNKVENLGGPFHASCKLTWTFENDSCDDVAAALVKSADGMNAEEGWESSCGEGQKCGYVLTGDAKKGTKGTHTTPAKHYIDDIDFSFKTKGSGCVVQGHSTSETFYAVLDFGTNYCNLSNLGTDTGLTYGEVTSDNICTQYSKRNCDKF